MNAFNGATTTLPAVPDLSDPALFEPVGAAEKQGSEFVRPSQSYWQDAWRRLKRDRLALLGGAAILLILLLAVVGP